MTNAAAAVSDSKFRVHKKSSYTIHPAPYPYDVPGAREFSLVAFYATLCLPPLGLLVLFNTPFWSFIFWFALTSIPCFMVYNLVDSVFKNWAFGETAKTAGLPLEEYMTVKDPEMSLKYKGKSRIPMEVFFEAYFDQKIDINGDMLDLLENRHDWASFQITVGHLKFLAKNLLPEALFHTRNQDESQVREHYDRGNDFYDAFLGPMMIYTSGVVTDLGERQSLETLQENKLNLVLNKIQLKPEEKLLDIGCGWGTLLAHAAKNFGASVTGVTLAREQTEFGQQRAKEYGVEDKVKIMCCDYRDIPPPSAPNGLRYDKITCLEMAEHVGIRRFQQFLSQVSDLLKDDGLFYLQIAGLRRPWQYEDLVWGMFMNKYIFPGADASCPLGWVVQQLEYAGFEVQSVDTIGVHYSATLERWYQNWMRPEYRERITAKYGERWWRLWEFFLAWSTIIARQGSATCYQLVCHKNSNRFDRSYFIQGYGLKRLAV